ncbi:MAG TPA: pilus assembly protein TadG-related protein [Rhizomicrobium sp.]|nr:pilus assembly protein TadG-related protein [Rhizomicrobium sp.]
MAVDDEKDAAGVSGKSFLAVLSGARQLTLAFLRDRSGNYAIIAALASPLLIGAAGLATEGGLWYNTNQTLQGAADSAALSAATKYGLNRYADLDTQAKGVVATYGYTVGTASTTVTVNRPASSGSYSGNTKSVEVIVTTQHNRLLSSIYASAPVTITARSVALPGSDGKGCVLALNASASGAVTSQGTSNVTLNGCSLYDNSSSSSGLTNGGSATISAYSVNVVGDISGGAGITTTDGVNKGVSPADDPYASINPPSFAGCTDNNLVVKTTKTINPGVYCNGIQLNAGADLTLNPGTYYIDRGDLKVNGGATIRGNGVTIVFTSSTGSNYGTATINGGATVAITAPTTGPLAGIAMFGDRSMPTGSTFKFNGGAGQILGGAVYLPKGHVEYAGGAATSLNCTQLIGDTIKFTGNSDLAINCSSFGTQPIGTSPASLVE